MGNKCNKEKSQDVEVEEAIAILRQYYAHTHGKYSNAIGKFLKDIDESQTYGSQLTQTQLTHAYQSKREITQTHAYQSKCEIGKWLKQQRIYDPNIEYMLRLQGVIHQTDFKTYTQDKWDELYAFCVDQCCRNQQDSKRAMLQKFDTMHASIKVYCSITINHKAVYITTTNTSRMRASINQMTKHQASQPIETSDESKMFSYREILVNGYIRDLGEHLLPNVIIPIDICHLCLKYYSHNELFLFCLPVEKEWNSNLDISCVKIRNNFYSKHKVRVLELKTLQESPANEWRIRDSSLCFKQSVKLPSIVINKLCDAYRATMNKDYNTHSQTDTYSIIFNRTYCNYQESAVWNKKCNVICFNDRELYNNDLSHIVGFKFALPKCKRELSELSYSDRYGLIAVGGGISIYNLSFRNKHYHQQNKKEWKWSSFGHLLQRRKQFVSVMLDAKRLMVIGGDRTAHDATSELIDLSAHRNARTLVTECNATRKKCGIMYDDYNKRVFVGGGSNHASECYDAVNDVWSVYAEGIESHVVHSFNHWPVLYSTDKEVIFMMDSRGNIVFNDLRTQHKKWKHYKPNISTSIAYGADNSHRIVA